MRRESPENHPDLDLEQRREVRREACAGMAAHSRRGLVAFPAAFLLLGATAGYLQRPLFWALFAVNLLATVGRAWLVLRFDTCYAGGSRRWRGLFAASLLASAAAWGLLTYRVVLELGFAAAAFLALLISIALASQAIIMYAQEFALVAGYLVVTIVPPVTALAQLPDAAARWTAIGALIYGGYCWASGHGLHRGLWRALVNTRLLERRADELRRAKEAAERADEAKGMFLANMSHEIRTPMAGVLGLAQLMNRTELDRRQRHYLDNLRSSAESLLEVIDDILDFSKIEAGTLSLDRDGFDLHQLLERTVELMRPRAVAKGVRLELMIDPSLPERVVGAPARLRQVLLNLLSNAVKFTEEGSVVVAAQRLEEGGEGSIRVRFSVTDTGIGIEPGTEAQLFEPFTQAEGAANRRFEGSGLGLAICWRLVELMGGRIEVESAPEGGASFRFDVVLEGAGQTTGPAASPVTEVDGAGRRILVAEDNPINQLVILERLEGLGFTVDAVSNGREVVEALSRSGYDLVLMDCQMPEVDGYEATRRIRRLDGETRRVPVVALTAHAMKGDREKCLDAGMDDYLAKPFTEERLLEILGRWLDRPRPQGR